jgi:hypothetical protein
VSKPIIARVRLNYTYADGDRYERDVLVECAARPPEYPTLGDIRAICDTAKSALIDQVKAAGGQPPVRIEARYLGAE